MIDFNFVANFLINYEVPQSINAASTINLHTSNSCMVVIVWRIYSLIITIWSCIKLHLNLHIRIISASFRISIIEELATSITILPPATSKPCVKRCTLCHLVGVFDTNSTICISFASCVHGLCWGRILRRYAICFGRVPLFRNHLQYKMLMIC